MTSIHLVRVRRQYSADQRPVLSDLDLSVSEGEFLSLLGPSGGGKSSILRIIAGLDSPNDGDVRFGGHSVLGVEAKDRGVAVVFQQYALYPNMTARKNLEYPLRPMRLSESERSFRIQAFAELLELEDLLDRYPDELSGGEQQRVALGRAMVRHPRVALLDEPLANLDPLLRLRLREHIRASQRATGATMVMVTHDQSDALAISDRIAVLNEGQIEQIGSPREVYDHPATTFVGQFVGSPPMNLIEVDNAGTRVIAERWTAATGRSVPTGEWLAGIRAEDVRMAPGEAGPLRARVEFVEPQGRFAVVTTTLIETPTSARVRFLADLSTCPLSGEVVMLDIDVARLRWFDRTMGHAVDALP
jgi:multiple sugar transport system ATP-binding protein